MNDKIFIQAKLQNGERILLNSERVLYYICPEETYQQGRPTGIVGFDNGEKIQVLNDYEPFREFGYLTKPSLPQPVFIDRREKPPYIRRRTR